MIWNSTQVTGESDREEDLYSLIGRACWGLILGDWIQGRSILTPVPGWKWMHNAAFRCVIVHHSLNWTDEQRPHVPHHLNAALALIKVWKYKMSLSFKLNVLSLCPSVEFIGNSTLTKDRKGHFVLLLFTVTTGRVININKEHVESDTSVTVNLSSEHTGCKHRSPLRGVNRYKHSVQFKKCLILKTSRKWMNEFRATWLFSKVWTNTIRVVCLTGGSRTVCKHVNRFGHLSDC